MRRALITLGSVLVAIVGVIALIAFFNSRDPSTTGTGTGAPARPAGTTATGASPLLRAGNVELRYSDPAFTPRLLALARSLGATDSRAARAAGQAVVLRRAPGVGGIRARALGRSLAVATPADPQLQAFVERWLGRAPG